MVLQRDVSLRGHAVPRPFVELAGRDQLLPFVAVELVVGHQRPVEPLLDVISLHPNPHMVPLAHRLHRTFGCRVEAVCRAS